jgi:hypothetical protein
MDIHPAQRVKRTKNVYPILRVLEIIVIENMRKIKVFKKSQVIILSAHKNF